MSQYYLGNLGNLVSFRQGKKSILVTKIAKLSKNNDSLFNANNEIIQIPKITSDFSKD